MSGPNPNRSAAWLRYHRDECDRRKPEMYISHWVVSSLGCLLTGLFAHWVVSLKLKQQNTGEKYFWLES